MPSQSRIVLNQSASHRVATRARRDSASSSTDLAAHGREHEYEREQDGRHERFPPPELEGDERGTPLETRDSHEQLLSGQDRSDTPPALPSSSTGAPPTALHGQAKFKSAVRKVIYTKRLTGHYQELSHLASSYSHNREPGIDPHRVSLPDLKARAIIQAVDFSPSAASFHVLTASTLPSFLSQRPPSSKVRWLHVNGLSWDVLQPLAIEYGLHPLSLEDVLHHGTQGRRSKVDYFGNHLFVSVVVHRTEHAGEHAEEEDKDHKQTNLGSDEEREVQGRLGEVGSFERYAHLLDEAFKGAQDEEGKEGGSGSDALGSLSKHGSAMSMDEKRFAKRRAAQYRVQTLSKNYKIPISITQLSIFLLRCGTIISVTPEISPRASFSGIFERINRADSTLRSSSDASLLMQALLDVVGDDALGIVDSFREELTILEGKTLTIADMGTVRHLHALSAQLLLLKSTVAPLQALIQSLRYSDTVKASAATKVDGSAALKHAGFVSPEAKVYLGDVLDHVESVLSSLDLFSGIAENLIAFTFNELGYSTNAFMKQLSVLSVVFLPLTFLSGYYGMNFETFPGVLDGSVSHFYRIAFPITFLTVVVFAWEYILELGRAARRRFVGTRKRGKWE